MKQSCNHQSISNLKFSFNNQSSNSFPLIKISDDKSLDTNRRPRTNSILDPRLGVDAFGTFSSKCVFCHQERLKCFGHFGKIELFIPNINPIQYVILKKYLESICWNCHELKIETLDLQNILNKKKQYNYKDLDIIEDEGIDLTSPQVQLLDLFFKMCKKVSKCKKCSINSMKIKKANNQQFYFQDKNTSAPTSNQDLKQYQHNLISTFKIQDILKKSFEKNEETLKYLFEVKTTEEFISMFIVTLLPVMPNRFRPMAGRGDDAFHNPFSNFLIEILKINTEIKLLLKEMKVKDQKIESLLKNEKNLFNNDKFTKAYFNLQTQINLQIDSTLTKERNQDKKGIRQLLEKKEGIFRMKMMGKRVNYAARSVISPDPYLDTDEIGMPLFMAKKLLFPESVNRFNINKIKSIIKNGENYPGFNSISDTSGKRRLVNRQSTQQLKILSKNLENSMTSNPPVVQRHVLDGDNIIFNRQPTLHKPSMMGFKVRVYKNNQTVLRMHYANCATFNADFDGDEMNVHLPQSLPAQVEIQQIMQAKYQYISGTKGEPLRGLIQDHVISAVHLTSLDTFIDAEVYKSLVFNSLARAIELGQVKRVELGKPTVIFPKKLYTGKQVITCILANILPKGGKLNHSRNNKVGKSQFGDFTNESVTKFQNGILIHGIMDKTTFGSQTNCLVHAIHELQGEKQSELLLSIFSRLFTFFLQFFGHSCGLDDLVLTEEADQSRKKTQEEIILEGFKSTFHLADMEIEKENSLKKNIKKFVKNRSFKLDNPQELNEIIENKKLSSNTTYSELDNIQKRNMKDLTSKLDDEALKGFKKMFPANQFGTMVLVGAKGSNVNHKFCSVQLGQQELEGKRVPEMAGGRTLPCFPAHCSLPGAGGQVTSRFIDGLKPYEFYFHCMAGREGLIDTAIKTANSGQLQRCIIKGMENLKVEYDTTVRNEAGEIFQFLYGEDGLDPIKVSMQDDVQFQINNVDNFYKIYKIEDIEQLVGDSYDQINSIHKRIVTKPKYSAINIQSKCNPYIHFGATSIKYYQQLHENIISSKNDQIISNKDILLKMMYKKYHKSLVAPGENVGTLAGQGVGEPSTQMTLNTFHLAGHGGVNVTLGIPRLREIIMTNGANIKTPIMRLQMVEGADLNAFKKLSAKLSSVQLNEIVKQVSINESYVVSFDTRVRNQRITLFFEELSIVQKNFSLNENDIIECVGRKFIPILRKKLYKAAEKKSSMKSLQKSIKSAELALEQEEIEEIDDLLDINLMNQNKDDEETKHEGRITEQVKEDQDEDEVKEDNELEYIDADPNYDFKFNKKQNKLTFELDMNLGHSKLIIDSQIKESLIQAGLREITGVKKSVQDEMEVSTGKGKQKLPTIVVNGANFEYSFLSQYAPQVDTSKLYSNHINQVSKVQGIEAARALICREISAVFGVQGIKIDPRHLSLISDQMTRGGGLRAFNRKGMALSPSAIQRMSFETVVGYLKDACLVHEEDFNTGISANIVTGTLAKSGTGMIDILMDLSNR